MPEIEHVDAEGMLTTSEMCRRLQVTRRTVYRWRHEGRLSGVKVGGRLYFTEDECDRMAERFDARRGQ